MSGLVFILSLIVAAGAAETMLDSPVAAVIAVTALIIMVRAERRLNDQLA